MLSTADNTAWSTGDNTAWSPVHAYLPPIVGTSWVVLEVLTAAATQSRFTLFKQNDSLRPWNQTKYCCEADVGHAAMMQFCSLVLTIKI